MKSRSLLENFLLDQYSLGNVDSEGHFTLAADSAVKKLGQSALPSEVSWVLKAAQAAVRLQSVESMDIKLFCGFLDMEFQGAFDWDLPRLHSLVDDLEARPSLWELDLLAAIRDRLVEEYQFVMTVSERVEILLWTGEELRIESLDEPASRTAFSVQTGKPSYSLSPGMSLQMLENMRLGQGISDHLFFCPIPVTLDGRRIDTIHRLEAEENRYGILVNWGFHEGKLKDLALPQFPSLDEQPDPDQELPAALAALESSTSFSAPSKVSEAWLLRANYSVERSDRTSIWRQGKSKCLFLFVRAGVVVDSHEIDIPALHVTLTIVVNCERHLHDISGFRLIENEVLKARKERALKDVLRVLPQRLNIESTPKHKHTGWLETVFNYLFPGSKEIVQNSEDLEDEIAQSYLKLQSYLRAC